MIKDVGNDGEEGKDGKDKEGDGRGGVNTGGGSCWSASTVNPPSRDCHCSSVHCLETKVWLQTQCSTIYLFCYVM